MIEIEVRVKRREEKRIEEERRETERTTTDADYVRGRPDMDIQTA